MLARGQITVTNLDDGIGVKGVTGYYLASPLSEGIRKDTPGWTTEMQPLTPENKYLWNKEIVHYTDNESALKDKTEVLSGEEIYTDKADADAVVHVEVDGKSVGVGNNNLLSKGDIQSWNVTTTWNGDVSVIEAPSTGGLRIHHSLFDMSKEYVLGFKAKLISGTINGIRGHSSSFNTIAYQDDVLLGTWAGNVTAADKPLAVGVISEFKILFNKKAPTEDWLYIQPNRSAYGEPFKVELFDFQINEGSALNKYEGLKPTPSHPIEIHSVNDFDVVSSVGLNNQFLNTDFKQGMTHWSFTLSDGGISGNEGYTTAKSRYGGLQQSVPHYESLRGHVLYGRVDLKSDSVSSYFVFFNDGFNQTTRTISSSAVGKFTTLSATSTVSNEAKHLYCRTQDSRTEGWTENRIKNLYVLDLTEIYGKGNEPTQAEMDALLKDKWAPSVFDITEDGSSHPSIDKTNILLSQPLRSVGNVKDRLFRDTDGLWKVERNVGAITLDGSRRYTVKVNDNPEYSSYYFSDRDIAVMAKMASSHYPFFENSGLYISREGQQIRNYSDTSASVMITDYTMTHAQFQNKLRNSPVTVIYEKRNTEIEILPQSDQDKLNNIASYKDSNYLYTIVDKTNILPNYVSEKLKPTLHATFKSKAWSGNNAGYPAVIGVYGDSAKMLYLSATAESMTFNADGTPNPSSQVITLTANLQNVSRNASFAATAYNGSTVVSNVALSGVGNTRTFNQAQFPASANRVQVRATLGNLVDTVTIVKLANGSNGQNAVVGLLTNESITLPANKDGLVSSFTGATGVFDVYDGITKKTGLGVKYSLVNNSQSNITVNINATTGAYSVTAMPTGTTVLNGYATLRAIYNGVTIEKQLNVSKSVTGATGATGSTGAPGASATSYWITASNNIIGKSQTGVINPTTITFKGFSKTGIANSAAYAGRFIIQTSTNGTTYTTRYTSSADQNSYTYTIPTDSLFVKCLFYMAGGTSVLLDEQTVPVVESAEGISTSVRNLVTSTSTLDDMGDSQKANGVRLEEDRHMGNLSIKRTFVSGNADAYHQQTSVPMTGKEYVVTFWAKADRPLTFWNYLYNPDTITSSANSDGYKSTTVNGSSGLQATTEWKKYWIKWTQNSSPSKKYLLLGRLTSAGTIWINSPMLVEGNVPVDWQPAPEDARTYKAWANSSDGTADFTRVYPNENLIVTSTVEEGKYIADATGYPGSSISHALTDFIPAEKSQKYVLHSSTKLLRQMRVGLYAEDGSFEWFKLWSGNQLAPLEFETLATTANIRVSGTYTDDGGSHYNTWKLEKGTTPTIYTTNTADSLTGSVPKYVGFSPLDSNKPSDYEWILNPDYAENSSREYAESKIEQTSTDIMMSVTESFVGSDEFGEYMKSVGTQFQQTADDFNFIFGEIQESISGVEQKGDENYSNIQKYIRFEDGNIILGSSDSDSTLQITKDEIAFMQGGDKVAYFSGQSFYINKGILVESMQVGEHRMTKSSSGHTSFDWI